MESVTKNGSTPSAAGQMPPRDRRIYANYFRERLAEMKASPYYEENQDLADRLRRTVEELEEGLDETVDPRGEDVAGEGR